MLTMSQVEPIEISARLRRNRRQDNQQQIEAEKRKRERRWLTIKVIISFTVEFTSKEKGKESSIFKRSWRNYIQILRFN